MHCLVLLVTSLLFVEADRTKLIDNMITERWKDENVRLSRQVSSALTVKPSVSRYIGLIGRGDGRPDRSQRVEPESAKRSIPAAPTDAFIFG